MLNTTAFGLRANAMTTNNKDNGKRDHSCIGAGFVALDVVRVAGSASAELRFAGGSCGNVLTILSYLGWQAFPVGRIGDDAPAGELLEDLRRWSVDTRYLIQEADARTPLVFQEIIAMKDGSVRHRFSRVCPCCGSRAAGYRPFLKRDLASVAMDLHMPAVFYFDRVAHSNIQLAEQCAEQGALVVFEPSGVKDESLFLRGLRASHIFKYSHERLNGVRGLASRARVPVEVETRGGEGLRVTVRSKRGKATSHDLPAFRAPRLRDAAGSGDWCTAGLAYALVDTNVPAQDLDAAYDEIEAALRYGQALAALNCAFEGARGLMYVMKPRDALRAVRNLLDRNEAHVKKLSDGLPGSRGATRSTACGVCSQPL